ncbi:DUF2496 domain-containing protein [Erwinia sp. OLTSP20]|uniref:pleiotropic regulatory protein RsmS n=1 Tax=unclassified Erwinia TaxID=2622719 RepID=UPI000C1A7519|nr:MULTISPECIES: pleiotropic regulatory protein RsmS [unclassified Erwinia]PIJ50614.1 DUF2496 domain-containing protein [Erwinia sp. OAMSP11]PIJ72660.1 DUF2496 domain-containing protein [Erwinia sp. OLSSP12]PIJ83257.1 DUF2496 domain-containing protein [Erwinia sp. OLCASP19]PIJ85241.1 DUF2496 domain-containing protein [Erwinia sp. OLMTSP26]PIJ87244.1 DUF2496 domain-containing protein [Erwinia sp. OLMDSP33]
MTLENAPPELKLAVDLIMILEENQIDSQTVLAALEIVKRDYQKKLLPGQDTLTEE